MFVKPKNGLRVRDPVKGSALPETGADVPDNTFWRRRISDGDVSVVKPSATSAKKKGDAE